MSNSIRGILRGLAWLGLSILGLYWFAVGGQFVSNYRAGGWAQAADYLRDNARAFEPRILTWTETIIRYCVAAILTGILALGLWVTREQKVD